MAKETEEILEIPEVRVVGNPIENDIADARIKLLKSYLAIKERAKKGEHITADDFTRAENEYNKVMKPINDDLRVMPKEAADEIREKANKQLQKWHEENPSAKKELNNTDDLNEIFRRDYIKDAPAKHTSIAPSTNTPKELLVDLLSKNPGIAIGDYHNSSSSYPLVSNNMTDLKKAGVDTIYFDADSAGFSKLSNMSIKDLKEELAKRTPEVIKQENEKGGPGSYKFKEPIDRYGDELRLFLAAKENGIRIINIDKDDPARGFESGGAGNNRTASTNYTWTERILEDHKEMPRSGKYIILGGGGHFGSSDYETTKGYVDDRLGIPFVTFDNRDVNEKSPILKGNSKNGADYYLPNGECHPDIKRLTTADDYNDLAKQLQKNPDDYKKILDKLKKELDPSEQHKLMLESQNLNAPRLAAHLQFRAEIMRYNFDIHMLKYGCVERIPDNIPAPSTPSPQQSTQENGRK
ncbi:MAG: hypothetical protein AABY33_00420 [Pseudomonadota bacterium]